MNITDKLYEMGLFEYCYDDENNIGVTRVPGGWIINQTFVPYNDEFKPKQNQTKPKSENYPIGYLGCSFEIPRKIPEKFNSHLHYAYFEYYKASGKRKDIFDIAKDFLDYWQTKDKSGKMVYEKETKFNLPLRIATWLKNNKTENEKSDNTGINRQEV